MYNDYNNVSINEVCKYELTLAIIHCYMVHAEKALEIIALDLR